MIESDFVFLINWLFIREVILKIGYSKDTVGLHGGQKSRNPVLYIVWIVEKTKEIIVENWLKSW